MLSAWPVLADLPTPDDFKPEGLLARDRATPGVYILFSDTDYDRPVYVGQSGDVLKRLAQHRAERTKAFKTARFYHLADLQARLILEGLLVLLLRPPSNRALSLGLSGGRVWEIRWKRSSRK